MVFLTKLAFLPVLLNPVICVTQQHQPPTGDSFLTPEYWLYPHPVPPARCVLGCAFLKSSNLFLFLFFFLTNLHVDYFKNWVSCFQILLIKSLLDVHSDTQIALPQLSRWLPIAFRVQPPTPIKVLLTSSVLHLYTLRLLPLSTNSSFSIRVSHKAVFSYLYTKSILFAFPGMYSHAVFSWLSSTHASSLSQRGILIWIFFWLSLTM
jgi:hypothetical protein